MGLSAEASRVPATSLPHHAACLCVRPACLRPSRAASPPNPHPTPPTETPRLQAERVLAAADDWHFDAFRLEQATQGHALSCLAFYLLQRTGLVRRFSLNPLLLARWGVPAVAAGMAWRAAPMCRRCTDSGLG